MNEYIIVNKTSILKRIEELEDERNGFIYNPNKTEDSLCYNSKIRLLKQILSQSIPLIPELQKTWNAAYIDALSIDEETYKPLFFEDYITNLKLDI